MTDGRPSGGHPRIPGSTQGGDDGRALRRRGGRGGAGGAGGGGDRRRGRGVDPGPRRAPAGRAGQHRRAGPVPVQPGRPRPVPGWRGASRPRPAGRVHARGVAAADGGPGPARGPRRRSCRRRPRRCCAPSRRRPGQAGPGPVPGRRQEVAAGGAGRADHRPVARPLPPAGGRPPPASCSSCGPRPTSTTRTRCRPTSPPARSSSPWATACSTSTAAGPRWSTPWRRRPGATAPRSGRAAVTAVSRPIAPGRRRDRQGNAGGLSGAGPSPSWPAAGRSRPGPSCWPPGRRRPAPRCSATARRPGPGSGRRWRRRASTSGFAGGSTSPILFGIDLPMYLVDHAAVARDLAPEGGGLVHVLRYLLARRGHAGRRAAGLAGGARPAGRRRPGQGRGAAVPAADDRGRRHADARPPAAWPAGPGSTAPACPACSWPATGSGRGAGWPTARCRAARRPVSRRPPAATANRRSAVPPLGTEERRNGADPAPPAARQDVA